MRWISCKPECVQRELLSTDHLSAYPLKSTSCNQIGHWKDRAEEFLSPSMGAAGSGFEGWPSVLEQGASSLL